MMSWTLTITVISALLAALLVYREYQRENKGLLAWRMAAVLIATAALACIILPISYRATITSTTGAGKILLTDGFDADSLKGNNDSIFTLSKAIHHRYPKAKWITSTQELFGDSAHLTPVHIYGYGLNYDELSQLSGRPVIFHPTALPAGFASASWTETIKAGRPFTVKGSYRNTSAKACTLLLKGSNTSLDSITVPANVTIPFSLRSTPKSNGRVVYQLLALDGRDTLQQEHLPLTIEPVHPLKVLMLSSTPDFEAKFLKNWLAGNGYGVASRSAITKGKFGQEYLNMDQLDLTHITALLLSKFDVLIGDLSALKGLSPSETSALQQEVAQKGLGIIIRSDSSGKALSWLQGSFPVSYPSNRQQVASTLNIQGAGKTAKLAADPIYIIPQNNTQQLVTDEHGHSLTAMTIDGAGKLVFTTINNSYSWMLAGNAREYAMLWSLLIDKAARQLTETAHWSVASSLPTVNEPARLTLEAERPLNGVTFNNTIVHPQQDAAIPFRQVYTYWPEHEGWQRVAQSNSTLYWWYAWKNNEWLSLKAAKRSADTWRYADRNRSDLAVTKQIQQKTRIGVPKIYFYILFLIAATFLWAESKFFS